MKRTFLDGLVELDSGKWRDSTTPAPVEIEGAFTRRLDESDDAFRNRIVSNLSLPTATRDDIVKMVDGFWDGLIRTPKPSWLWRDGALMHACNHLREFLIQILPVAIAPEWRIFVDNFDIVLNIGGDTIHIKGLPQDYCDNERRRRQ